MSTGELAKLISFNYLAGSLHCSGLYLDSTNTNMYALVFEDSDPANIKVTIIKF